MIGGIVAGVVVANAIEWTVHRYLLHGLGRNRDSFWAFHWHEHHGAARRNDHIDEAYQTWAFGWNAQGKEALSLLATGIGILPIAWISPSFVATLFVHGLIYHRLHRWSHLDPEFARKWLPWHYDHHMGPNQNMNWCVTWPLFDWIMGTREVYYGTDKEREDRARRQARMVARQTPQAAPA